MQRLQQVQTASASRITDKGIVVALKLTFDFKSDEGAYPETSYCLFERGQTVAEVVDGLKSLIQHLETRAAKSR